jgi:hypothetical protein
VKPRPRLPPQDLVLPMLGDLAPVGVMLSVVVGEGVISQSVAFIGGAGFAEDAPASESRFLVDLMVALRCP